MRDRTHSTLTTLGLLCGLLLGPLAAAAGAASPSPTPPPDRRARREVRVLRPDGSHRQLWISRDGKRGFLGVELLELTRDLRRHFGAGEDAGVLIARVDPDSPAAQAGVAVGDVLVAIDGKPVKAWLDMREQIAPHKEGDVVSLDVLRDGNRQRLQATLVERQGRVLELGWPRAAGDGDDPQVLVLPDGKDWEAFGEDMGRWGEEVGATVAEAFANPQVRQRLDREVQDREQLQRKIEALEQRLRDLEKRLDQQRR